MKENLRSIHLIYLGQVISLISFSAVVLFLNYSDERQIDEVLIGKVQYPLSFVFILGLAASQLLSKYMLKKIDRTKELKNKITAYFPVVIIRTACLEAPGLFACVVALLTRQTYYLLVIPLLLILFMLYWPTRSTIANELGLSIDERERLNATGSVIS